MAQRHGASWSRSIGSAATSIAAALLLGSGAVSAGGHGHGGHGGHGHGGHGHGGHGHGGHGDHGDDQDGPGYKGTASLDLISVAPNPARCGAAPNMEVVFEGSGLDTAGGITSIESSACQNLETGEVFDLVAVDTYAGGDTINIVSDSFYFVLDPETCVSTNIDPVEFDVDGGTGIFAGIEGGGLYDISFNDPTCNGVVTPAFIAFRGYLHD